MKERITLNVMGIEMAMTVSRESLNSEKMCTVLEGVVCHQPEAKCSSGYLLSTDSEGMLHAIECENCIKAANLRRLRNSGLGQRAVTNTFEAYQTPKPWNCTIKSRALEYVQSWKDFSFFISGQSGCGKTHICTAICNALIAKGVSPQYFQWTQDGGHLKGIINERELYEPEIKKYMDADILFIDDFFKQEITTADIRLAYELINARYNAGLPVVISTERTMEYIMDARNGDGHAIAGRLKEMCGDKFVINVTGEDKDYRLFHSAS